MRLLEANKLAAKYFAPESKPSRRRLRRLCLKWAKQGMAQKVGGLWYVDEHKWLAQGDPLVEQALAG